MFCFNCGKEVNGDAQICPFCGKGLKRKAKSPLKIIFVMFSTMLSIIIVVYLFIATIPLFIKKTNENNFLKGAKEAESVIINVLAMERVTNGGIFTASRLIDCFTEVLNAERTSYNVLEGANGIFYYFYGSGKCTNGSCKIIVDVNGNDLPNKLWTKDDEINDRIEFKIVCKNGYCKPELSSPNKTVWYANIQE